MARSVLKIDVDDEAFKRFHEEFKKYEKSRVTLAKNPVGGGKKEAAEEEASLKRRNALIVAGGKATQASGKAAATFAGQAARSWEAIATRTKQAATNIQNMTMNLLRQVSLGAAIGSLAGVGGSIWGLDRLAQSASAGRRSATGLGASYGEQQAFGLTFGRLVDTGSFLGGISSARGNLASPATAALLSLGIDPTRGGSTGELAGRSLDAIRRLAQNTPEHLLGVLPQSHMLDSLGMDVETLRRLKGTSSEEYLQYRNEYTQRREKLDISDPVLRKWQDFTVQLDVAGEKIKTGLINGLVQLMPHLTRLSDVISDFAQSILGSKGAKAAVDWLAGGLKTFGDYLQKEEFKKDVKDFVAGISALASAVSKGLKLLGIIPDSGGGGGGNAPTAMTYEDFVKNRMASVKDPDSILGRRVQANLKENYKEYLKSLGIGSPADIYGGGPGSHSGAGLNISDPLIRALAISVAGIESRGGPNNGYGALGPVHKPTGDRPYGKYQVMGNNIGSWSKDALGRTLTPQEFLQDPAAQDAVFQHKMREYIKKYGTPQDALSMWHSGVPLAQATAEGRRDVNMSTAQYVAKTNAQVRVILNDNTGGNVNSQINQIAY